MKIGRVFLGVALIVALAVAALLHLARSLPTQKLRPALESRLSEVFGLDVAIGGELQLDPWPPAHLEVQDVTVANLPGRPSPHLLTVAEIRLDLALWALLRGAVSIDRIELIGAELRIEPSAEGELPPAPALEELDDDVAPPSAAEAGMAFHVREVHFENLRVFFAPAGGDDVTTLHLDVLELSAEDPTRPIEVIAEGAYEGSVVALEAELGSMRDLIGPELREPYPVRVTGRLMEAEVEAEGVIAAPMKLDGVDLAFRLVHADPEVLQLQARGLPDFQELSMAGRLRNPGGVYGIDALALEAGVGGPFKLRVEGSVRDVANLRGVDVQVQAEASDLDLFEDMVPVPLPDVPAALDVRLDDSDGSLGVEGEAEVGREGAFALAMQGAYDDVRGLSELDVGVLLEAPDLETLRRSIELDLQSPLPRLGPVKARANVRDFDGVLGLDGIDVQIGARDAAWFAVEGSIRDVRRFRGVKLEATAGGIETHHLQEPMGRELPDLGILEIEASLSDEDGSLGIERATLRGKKEELFEAHVHGSFEDLRGTNEIDVEASIRAQDLGVLGELLEMELPRVGPVAFSGKIQGSNERMKANGELKVRRTRILGDATASFPDGGRPRLVARVTSPAIFLADLGVEPGGPTAEAAGAREPTIAERWWSGTQPDAPKELRELGLDLDVQLRADQVSGRESFELERVFLDLKHDDGLLVVQHSGAAYEGGEVEVDLRLDARPAEPSWALRVETYNVDLTELMSQLEQRPRSAGLFDASIDLRARGTTRQEVLAQLEGSAGVMLRDGAVVSKYAEALSVSFLRLTVPNFNATARPAKPLHCLLGLFPLEDGRTVVDRLYLETHEMTVVGTGTIDLGRDELDLRLTPKLHEPGLVSIAATVDISGPIESPELHAVPSSLGASAARGVVDNLLRPLRAVTGLGRTSDPGVAPCDAMVARRREEMEADRRDAGPAYDPGAPGPLAPFAR